MGQESTIFKRKLQSFIKVKFLWLISLFNWKCFGINFKITVHFLHAHVGSVYAMWIKGLVICKSKSQWWSFWWDWMILFHKLGLKSYSLILFHPLANFIICWFKRQCRKFTSWVVRCEDNIPSWWLGGKYLHDSAKRVHCSGTRESSLQTVKELVWPKTSSKTMVQEIW